MCVYREGDVALRGVVVTSNSEFRVELACLLLQRLGKEKFVVFLTVHHSIDFSKYQLNAQFFYSSTIYRVSQEERTKLREGVPYVKLYRYNPKHLYPKLNCYGDNGQRSLKL